jgi:hypothetical protein
MSQRIPEYSESDFEGVLAREFPVFVTLVSVTVPLAFWLAALVIGKRCCKPEASFNRTPNGAA